MVVDGDSGWSMMVVFYNDNDAHCSHTISEGETQGTFLVDLLQKRN